MLLALLALALIALVLAAPILARRLGDWRAARSRPRSVDRSLDLELYDPGRERRAEQRARELLRSCVNEEEWAMYRDLDRDRGGRPPYAYLVYPQKPIVAFVPESGQLLSEYCVEFPDLTGSGGRHPLPASHDVLAKRMALTSHAGRGIKRA